MGHQKIKVAELFSSLQGEMLYTGVPSVFLRTFGCNFRCRNFGRDRGDISANAEVQEVIRNISLYKTYEELPLVSTGCDSYASVYPEFRDLSNTWTTQEIHDRALALLPGHAWRDVHLVITGGEPLLGWQRAYPELIELGRAHGLKNITFETNGTQKLTADFREYLFEQFTRSGRDYRNLTFSVSPKLTCSGEAWADAINPDIVASYQEVGETFLKFVVATEDDVQEVHAAVAEYRAQGFQGHVYLMPVGGVTSVFEMNKQQVAELAIKHGYRYSDRLQVSLWANAWGT